MTGAVTGLLAVLAHALTVGQGQPVQREGEAMSKRQIVEVSRRCYLRAPRRDVPIFMSTAYLGSGLRRMEVFFEETGDDYWDTYRERTSDDNGKTWTAWAPQPARYVWQGEHGIHIMDCAYGYDPVSRRTISTFVQVLRPGDNEHTFYRLSEDDGRTWTPDEQLKYEDGPDFDPKNWADPEYVRTNWLCGGYNIEPLRNGTIACPGFGWYPQKGAKGQPVNTLAVWCWIGKWNKGTQDYDWTVSAPIAVPPEVSSRGLFEPAIAELRNRDLFMEMRGSNTATTPGHKWISVSRDGGHTWSAARDMRYDDGQPFYAPSSLARLIRSTRTGKLYWVGNISADPPSGNSPRYPLYVAEVDEAKHALKHDTLTLVDDRNPEKDPPSLQLSNFCAFENRRTGAIEIYMTRYFGVPPERPSDVYKYVLRLKR